MALAEALLKADYDQKQIELYEMESATEDAWDELWGLAQSPEATEGDRQVAAEAFGLAKLAEELKRQEAERARIEWRRAQPR